MDLSINGLQYLYLYLDRM